MLLFCMEGDMTKPRGRIGGGAQGDATGAGFRRGGVSRCRVDRGEGELSGGQQAGDAAPAAQRLDQSGVEDHAAAAAVRMAADGQQLDGLVGRQQPSAGRHGWQLRSGHRVRGRGPRGVLAGLGGCVVSDGRL